MKNIGTKLLALLALVLAIPACKMQEEVPVEQLIPGRVIFTAVGADSKTAFEAAQDGVYPCCWTGNNEKVAFTLDWKTTVEASAVPAEDNRYATMEADFDASGISPVVFRAMSPAKAFVSVSGSRKAWLVNMPVDQVPLATSADENAQLLTAVSDSYPELPSKVPLAFSHLSAYGRLAISGLQEGVTVNGVEITSTEPLAGLWYYSPEEGTVAANGSSSTISLETSSVDDVWFACMPCDMNGQKLTISIYTDAGVFQKTIEPRSGLAFESGHIARIAVSFSGIEPSSSQQLFRLVTDASSLSVGDEIIIVNKDRTYALGSQVSGKNSYRGREEVTVADEQIEDPGQATVLTLGAGSVSNTWSLAESSSSYLASMSSGNQLSTGNTVNSNSSWKITISGGVATIQAQAGASTMILYNVSSPRFSCYKSTSNAVQTVSIFRKEGGGAVVVEADPLTEFSEYGVVLDGRQRFYEAGTDQFCRQYATGSDVLTYTIMNPSTKEQIEISGYSTSMRKGDSATISVIWRIGLNQILKGSWKLTLVREDGPKVWLSDGKGGGVIIKK